MPDFEEHVEVLPVCAPMARTISLREIASTLRITEVPPLAPDLDYNLDAAIENGDITCDERAFVDLHDPGFKGWFDRNLTRPDKFVPEIRRRHASWRDHADPDAILALDWAGLLGLAIIFDDASIGVAHETARDALAHGGDAEAMEWAVGRAGDTAEARGFLAKATALLDRVREDVALNGVDRFIACRDGVARAYEARDVVRRAAMAERLAATRAGEGDATPSRRGIVAPSSRSTKAAKAKRRILAKSLDLLESIAGRPKARAWMSGEEVVVEGRRFDFRVRLADPHRTTHGAMDVFVTDKDKIELAKLCVYAPDTPSLDQIASLVLHVASGEEDGILSAANVIRYSDAGRSHDGLRQVRGTKDDTVATPYGQGIPDPLVTMAEMVRPGARRAFGQAVRAAFLPLASMLGDTAWIDAVIDSDIRH